MRGLIRALTVRGRSFVAAGAAAVLCGLLIPEPDLVRIGALLIALPLLSAFGAGRARYRLSCVRSVSPARLPAGQIKEYIIALCAATRTAPELRLGASPRAALQLLRASRARAALDGRDYVIPDDIQALAGPVLAHRLLPTAEALVERKLPDQVVSRLVEQTPLPRP